MNEQKVLELLSTGERLALRNIGEVLTDSSFQEQARIAMLIKLGLVDAKGPFLRLTKLGEAVVGLMSTSKERRL